MLVQLSRRKVLRRKLDRRLDPVDRPMEQLHCGFDLNLESSTVSTTLRLSQDVMEKAQAIADEWGLKTPRAAVEAVFRKYADEYMYGRLNIRSKDGLTTLETTMDVAKGIQNFQYPRQETSNPEMQCEAMNELDGLLGL